MGMLDQINKDTITALKASRTDAQAKITLSTLRMLSSDLKYKKIELKKEEVSEDDIFDVINSMIKKRRDSVEQYKKAGRDELAQKEQTEIEVLMKYLPAQLSDEELEAIVTEAIEKNNISSIKEMGKLMGVLVPQLKGKAEGSRISQLAKGKLTS